MPERLNAWIEKTREGRVIRGKVRVGIGNQEHQRQLAPGDAADAGRRCSGGGDADVDAAVPGEGRGLAGGLGEGKDLLARGSPPAAAPAGGPGGGAGRPRGAPPPGGAPPPP